MTPNARPREQHDAPRINPYRCAALVSYSKGHHWKQCSRYRGWGPGERYCRLHAEKEG